MCNGQKYCHGHYISMKIKATFFCLWLVSKPNIKNVTNAFIFDPVTNVTLPYLSNKVKGNFILFFVSFYMIFLSPYLYKCNIHDHGMTHCTKTHFDKVSTDKSESFSVVVSPIE